MERKAQAIEFFLTTKGRKELDELEKIQNRRDRHQSRDALSSEGWAGVMVLLGIVLAVVLAWKNGLLR
jgi:hypothetical protein